MFLIDDKSLFMFKRSTEKILFQRIQHKSNVKLLFYFIFSGGKERYEIVIVLTNDKIDIVT